MHSSFTSTFTRRAALAALLLCGATMAQAQYMWLDAKGVKHYSDRSPPTSVPLKDIKKAPKGQPSAENMPALEADADSAAASVTTAAATGAPKGPPTLAERDADYAKRQKAKLEQEKKEREQAEQKSAQRDNCDSARSARASLDSGARISVTNKNGERGLMDDAQRAAETRRIDKTLAGCPAG